MKQSMKKMLLAVVSLLTVFLLVACGKGGDTTTNPSQTKEVQTSQSQKKEAKPYTVSEEEKTYLSERFSNLSAVNPETIGYVYIPGTQLDEPVVQTSDNATYLDKTFEGENVPYMGTVFMDTDNSKAFDNSLTWLFGHARGSTVADHRMFNDVNYYDNQTYFDEHPYVVIETPERKYYYEAAFMIIVPETTAFYKTSFENKDDFKKQLTEVKKMAHTHNPKVTIDADDKYLVLSTCREDDDTIRANLYLRQIPDAELTDFLAEHGSKLVYQSTR